MSFGTTGGRGFEVPGASYIWGAAVLLAAVLWVRVHVDHKRHGRDDTDDGRDNED